jgi:hypothetical protein
LESINSFYLPKEKLEKPKMLDSIKNRFKSSTKAAKSLGGRLLLFQITISKMNHVNAWEIINVLSALGYLD